MERQEARNKALTLKKQLKKMSVGQVEQFLMNMFINAADEVAQAFKDELHNQFGFGEKRFNKLLDGVNKRLEGENENENNKC